MSRINIARAAIGGLVAGVVANAVDFVTNKYLMSAENTDMMQRLNLSAAAMESSIPTWIVIDFIWGLVLVFSYAAIRPRFGPGPKTATIAGVTLWLAVNAWFAGMSAMGIMPTPAFLKGAVLSLVSTLAAVLVGAAIYKEEA